MGFCVLNNAAVTAAYLRRVHGLTRILICDFDVHHGNGTQEIFYDSDQVLVVSLHQKNIFPFSGKIEELGRGSGIGYNINVPVYSQFGDLEYTYLLGQLVNAVVEQFMPQIILVSAGYDGHADDPISKTLLSTEWFGRATHMFKQFARDVCENRLLFILEGGYNATALEAGVLASLESLLDPSTPESASRPRSGRNASSRTIPHVHSGVGRSPDMVTSKTLDSKTLNTIFSECRQCGACCKRYRRIPITTRGGPVHQAHGRPCGGEPEPECASKSYPGGTHGRSQEPGGNLYDSSR